MIKVNLLKALTSDRESGTLAAPRQAFRRVEQWLRRRSQNLKISRKISYSYALSLGVAISGTALGLGVAHWQGRAAQRQFVQADRYLTTLYQLDRELIDMQSYPQRLLSVLDRPVWQVNETSQFEATVGRVMGLAEALASLEPYTTAGSPSVRADTAAYINLGRSYITLTQTYRQFVERAIQAEVSQLRSGQQALPEVRQALLTANTGDDARQLRVKFQQLSSQSRQLLEVARAEKVRAQAELRGAERLQFAIILSSMLLSALVAAGLIYRTSRAIAQPIEYLTRAAKSIVGADSVALDHFRNIPIYGQNEVGSLARSLEQMVTCVRQYTEQLKESRNSLERRVAQRTHELTDMIEALNQAQMQLVQSATLSSLGQLVAGVAHEINNPVGFIYGNVSYTQDYVQTLLGLLQAYQAEVSAPSPRLQAAIDEAELDFLLADLPKVLQSIQTGAERIHHIMRSLQKFSRLNETDLKSVDLHDCLDSTLLMLQHRLRLQSGELVQVVKRYGHLPPVECYPKLLNQVFINVLANALDALEAQSRTMRVSSSMVIVTTQQRGDKVAVTISDSGPGMAAEVRRQLFDPFFTTKPAGQGVGLGLSISQEIVLKRHCGTIECFSEPGRGARVVITIPVAQRAAVTPAGAIKRSHSIP